jgi:hypothetical protein
MLAAPLEKLALRRGGVKLRAVPDRGRITVYSERRQPRVLFL